MPIETSQIHGHEGDGIRAGWAAFAAAMLAASVPVILILLWLCFQLLAGGRYAGLTGLEIKAPQNNPPRVFPIPRLQTISGRQLGEVRMEEEQELNGYGWTDQKHEWARIPIDRAMDLIAQRGLPVGTNSVGKSEYELVIERRLKGGQ